MVTKKQALIVLLTSLLLVSAPLALAENHQAGNQTKQGDDGGSAADHTDGNQTWTSNHESDVHDHENGSSSDHENSHASEHGDHHDGADSPRAVHVVSHDGMVLWQLKSEGNHTEKQIKLLYLAKAGVLKLQLESEGAGNHTEFSYLVHFQKVVEYRDTNNNSYFDPHNDTTVSQYSLNHDVTWSVGQVQDVTVGNRTGKMVTATGTFDGSNGTMTVRFYAFGGFVDLNGTQLHPTDVKFDIAFDHYPWQGNDTRLALLLGTHVSAESHVEQEDGHHAVNATTSGGGISGYFTWASNATVDGSSSPVVAHVYRSAGGNESGPYGSEAAQNQELSLNYAHGTKIVHDPILGVTYASASSTSNALNVPFPGVALVLAGLVATALVVRRRKL